MNDDKVEQSEVEGTTEQESPTVEQNQPQDEATAESEDVAPEKPQERNWKALREENERLKALVNEKPVEERVPVSQRDINVLMSAEDKVELRIKEARAEQEFPEMETDPIFQRAVEGEYMNALAKYNKAVLAGQQASLPDPYKIAKSVKRDLDERLSTTSKKAEQEGAKKAQQAKESKEATVEAEGRSDRGRNAKTLEELSTLQVKTRRGDSNALAERLSRSGL